MWSKASLDTYVAAAEREKQLLAQAKRDANPYEGGFGGQEEMKDQCETERLPTRAGLSIPDPPRFTHTRCYDFGRALTLIRSRCAIRARGM